jgi:hypothetical protein
VAVAGLPLRLDEEPQRGAGETADDLAGSGFATRDDQEPSHVVGAVAVLPARRRVVGVLEEPALVGHAREVPEGRCRGDEAGGVHATTAP